MKRLMTMIAVAAMALCAGAGNVTAKVWGIGVALNDPDHTFTTDSGTGWVRDTAHSRDGVESMRSGAIDNAATSGSYKTSTMSTTVNGKGTVSFWWRASCEDDDTWDHGEFRADGRTWKIHGETDWQQVSYSFTTDGEHQLRWVYLKDDFGSEGNDCIWVDQFDWMPDEEACKIRFEANGGTGTMAPVVYRQGRVNQLPSCGFTAPSGARFLGWLGSDGKFYDDRMLVFEFSSTALTLTAQWTDTSLGVQLWESGPFWAECNVGASQPEEYGYYFWWGDTVGYTRSGGTWTDDWYYSGVTWVSSTGAKMSSSPFDDTTCPTYGKDNSQLQSEGYIDSTGNLVAAHDAATAHLGAPWRMPTDAEWDALISNCDTEWTTRNGVYGRLVTGRGAYASKSIFLPAAGNGYGSYLDFPGSGGYYWSSASYSDESYFAWRLNFYSGNFDRDRYFDRCYGQSVRPVRGFAQ